MKIGAWYQCDKSCEFTVWAPFKNRVEIKIISSKEFIIKLEKGK